MRNLVRNPAAIRIGFACGAGYGFIIVLPVTTTRPSQVILCRAPSLRALACIPNESEIGVQATKFITNDL